MQSRGTPSPGTCTGRHLPTREESRESLAARGDEMPSGSTYVVVATRGRPATVSRLVNHLQRQSCPPAGIILSGADEADIPGLPPGVPARPVLGPPGTPAQRNRALALVPDDTEYVAFFDDDFIPSRLWIERMQEFFAGRPDAVAVTGQVLADGAAMTTGSIEWAAGLSLVEKADGSAHLFGSMRFQRRPGQWLYGCNMAYRWQRIRGLRFDERLVLHGWLEDFDFGVRAVNNNGAAYWTDALWGVHLGLKAGRPSGIRYGYSQIINPWYLFRKGVATPMAAAGYIIRAISLNSVRCVVYDRHIDRVGRLRGNLIGMADIVSGRWKPERAAEL
jgi:Glycosyl transferase family 2